MTINTPVHILCDKKLGNKDNGSISHGCQKGH